MEEESDALEDELHNNDIGDVETNCSHKDMYHDIPYNRCYASVLDDDGLEEDVGDYSLDVREPKFWNQIGPKIMDL